MKNKILVIRLLYTYSSNKVVKIIKNTSYDILISVSFAANNI